MIREFQKAVIYNSKSGNGTADAIMGNPGIPAFLRKHEYLVIPYFKLLFWLSNIDDIYALPPKYRLDQYKKIAVVGGDSTFNHVARETERLKHEFRASGKTVLGFFGGHGGVTVGSKTFGWMPQKDEKPAEAFTRHIEEFSQRTLESTSFRFGQIYGEELSKNYQDVFDDEGHRKVLVNNQLITWYFAMGAFNPLMGVEMTRSWAPMKLREVLGIAHMNLHFFLNDRQFTKASVGSKTIEAIDIIALKSPQKKVARIDTGERNVDSDHLVVMGDRALGLPESVLFTGAQLRYAVEFLKQKFSPAYQKTLEQKVLPPGFIRIEPLPRSAKITFDGPQKKVIADGEIYERPAGPVTFETLPAQSQVIFAYHPKHPVVSGMTSY